MNQLTKTIKKLTNKRLEDIGDKEKGWFRRTQLYKTIQAIRNAK